jgi:hypothetical protein
MKSKSSPAKKTSASKPAAPPATPAKKTTAKKAAQKAAKTTAAPVASPPSSAEPIHTKESPFARGTRPKADRHEIREITHRVMGSRQSQRPAERHDQPRKKR